jgi:hypothetical protein
MTQQISPRDYELLSAYLDGELSTRDRAKLEARMTKQPELRLGLEELHQTKMLLRSLPQKRAPRNFTIPNALPRRRTVPRLFPALRFASALAGILFMIVFIGDYALGISTQSLVSKIPVSTSVPAATLENKGAMDTSAVATTVTHAPAAPPMPQVASPLPTEAAASRSFGTNIIPTPETPYVENGTMLPGDETPPGLTSQEFTATDEGPASGTGMGGGEPGSACGETCTPRPTATLSPTSEADTTDAGNSSGTPPAVGNYSASGSAAAAGTPTPTSTPETQPTAEETVSGNNSLFSQEYATEPAETAPYALTAPGARENVPTETPPAEAPTELPMPKLPAVTNNSQLAPETPAMAPTRSSLIAEPATPTIVPTGQQTIREKLSQPYTQMLVHIAEIGLAGFALLAGLAAIFLRINSRS